MQICDIAQQKKLIFNCEKDVYLKRKKLSMLKRVTSLILYHFDTSEIEVLPGGV